MSSLPRNMNLKSFDPHRAEFVCKHEADAVPAITPEAEALFQQGMTATSYERTYPKDTRDFAKAAQVWKQAADLGHWKAALNLAGLYETGQGVEQDTEKAVLIVEGLMKQGVPAAFYKMGSYYSDSIGVRGDSSRAYAFWQLAADKGNAAAQAFIGVKLLGAYDNPGQGFWGNREVGLNMLECSYAQGNGKAAFELGLTLDNTDEKYERALKILHDAVKFGSSESAGYLSASFRSIEPLTGNRIDTTRADRYRALRGALERNPDLRLPNLDKVLPLPPAELPLWDGKIETLVDAAKALVPTPAVQPTPGSQYPKHSRAHIPQGFGLPRNPLPPQAEQAAARWRPGDTVPEQVGAGVVSFTGYWHPQWLRAARDHEREWNRHAMPLRYAQGEAFDTPLPGMDRYAAVQWQYRGEAVKRADAAPHPKVAQGIARSARMPVPEVNCRGNRPCPRTGIWYAYLPKDHPLALRYNRWDRQAYLQAGQAFPDPAAVQLDIAASEVRWGWCDNANQSRPNGLVDVTLSDLHEGQDQNQGVA